MAPPIKDKEKKKRFQYTEESLKIAIQKIKEGVGIREASRQFGVPRATLQDYLRNKTDSTKRKIGPDPILGFEREQVVANWVKNIAKCGFPIKKQELLDTVGKIVTDENLPNPFKDGRPGDRWFAGFMRRNPDLAMREAEGINGARAAVTEESIRAWFDELKKFLDENSDLDILNDPTRIFNGDETGFAMCPKTGKVLGPKGFRNLYEIKKGKDKENITVLEVFSADGKVCPPCVVFPYIRPPKAVVESMPEDWILGKSETGWMKSDIFFEYVVNEFNAFITQNNIKKPVLLLVDGHKSHMSMSLSEMCSNLGIHLYALPPNTTHILQPADVSVFKPLKEEWKKTVRAFLKKPENVNQCVTRTNFCKLYKDALENTGMESHIKNGFRKCGLYPLDPNAVDYSKCVRNTLEELNQEMRTTSCNATNLNKITKSDINATEKVIKLLEPSLQDRGINTAAILEEIHALRDSSIVVNRSTDSTMAVSAQDESVNVDLMPHESTVDMNSRNESTSRQLIPDEFSVNISTHNDTVNSELIPDIGSYISWNDISVMPLSSTFIISSPVDPSNFLNTPSTHQLSTTSTTLPIQHIATNNTNTKSIASNQGISFESLEETHHSQFYGHVHSAPIVQHSTRTTSDSVQSITTDTAPFQTNTTNEINNQEIFWDLECSEMTQASQFHENKSSSIVQQSTSEDIPSVSTSKKRSQTVAANHINHEAIEVQSSEMMQTSPNGEFTSPSTVQRSLRPISESLQSTIPIQTSPLSQKLVPNHIRHQAIAVEYSEIIHASQVNESKTSLISQQSTESINSTCIPIITTTRTQSPTIASNDIQDKGKAMSSSEMTKISQVHESEPSSIIVQHSVQPTLEGVIATRHVAFGTVNENQTRHEPIISRPLEMINSNTNCTTNQSQLLKESKYKNFKRHLFFPEPIQKQNKSIVKKPRMPSAISSSEWRKIQAEKVHEKKEKIEETKKRKMERLKIKEEANKIKAARTEALKKRQGEMKDKKQKKKDLTQKKENIVPREKCSTCSEDLISDAEDDGEKNVGCDFCPSWYHLKCTNLRGVKYSDVAVLYENYKCEKCT